MGRPRLWRRGEGPPAPRKKNPETTRARRTQDVCDESEETRRHVHGGEGEEQEGKETAKARAAAKEHLRDRGAPSPRGVQVEQPHLRPGHRRFQVRGKGSHPVRVLHLDPCHPREPGVRGEHRRRCEGGEVIATKCKEKGISTVVFDKGGFLYHGRVKAVAEA